MRICWLTDIHINFLRTLPAVDQFVQRVKAQNDFEAVIISGDIAEARPLRALLNQLAESFGCTIYFVLGNHDYYGGSFASVKKDLLTTVEGEEPLDPNLVWLDYTDPILLDQDTALVGHQGWSDALLGDPTHTPVMLNDFFEIRDLKGLVVKLLWDFPDERDRLIRVQRRLGKDAAQALEPKLRAALLFRKSVIVVTHYPPFEGSCWHEGAISNADWLPWFTCRQMGEMLERVAAEHPDNNILVLCGHTHSPGVYQHAPNLRVLTGKSKYGHPGVAGMLELPLASLPTLVPDGVTLVCAECQDPLDDARYVNEGLVYHHACLPDL